jgi:hypothetical protein
MAAEWIPCGSGFIEADIVRWIESVWRRPRRNRRRAIRAVNVGERVVVAEVLRDEGGWLDLLVRSCTVTAEKPGHRILALPAGRP